MLLFAVYILYYNVYKLALFRDSYDVREISQANKIRCIPKTIGTVVDQTGSKLTFKWPEGGCKLKSCFCKRIRSLLPFTRDPGIGFRDTQMCSRNVDVKLMLSSNRGKNESISFLSWPSQF